MTLREIITFTDEIMPNTFSEMTKTRWLSQCDASIWNDVMLLPAWEFPGYRWDFDADRALIAPQAYEMMYVYWLQAQMHKAYQEIAEYTNDAQLYNSLRTRFVIWYADTFDPAHGGVMPLPPITSFRAGDDATILIGGFPYALSNVESMQIRIIQKDGTEILDDAGSPFLWPLTAEQKTTHGDYVKVENEYIVITFTPERTIDFVTGMYDVLISAELTNGQVQQQQALAGTRRINVLERVYTIIE